MGKIQTFTGILVNPFDLEPFDIRVKDIAKGLSNISRFGGHCSSRWSVAQHSMLVASLVEEQYPGGDWRLTALLHDAAEAYLGDIPTPLKRLVAYAPIRNAEDRAKEVIADVFGFSVKAFEATEIQESDHLACSLEREFFMAPGNEEHWGLPMNEGTVAEAGRKFIINTRSLAYTDGGYSWYLKNLRDAFLGEQHLGDWT